MDNKLNLFSLSSINKALQIIDQEYTHLVLDEVLGTGLLLSSYFKNKKGRYLIVCSSQYKAQKTYEFLLSFLTEDEVYFFPSDDLIRGETIASSNVLSSQRLYVLDKCLHQNNCIVVSHITSALRYLPNPISFQKATISLKVGEKIELNVLKEKLVKIGYLRVSKVQQALQFAFRGEIIDIFSINYANPIRIELFNDEIESLRFFDVTSQQSIKKINDVSILPSTDLYLNDDELNLGINKIKKSLEGEKAKLSETNFELLNQNVNLTIDDYLNSSYKPNLYKYFGFMLNDNYSICSYLKPDLVFIPNKEHFIESLNLFLNEAINYYSELREEFQILPKLSHFINENEAFKTSKRIFYGKKYVSSQRDFFFSTDNILNFSTNLESVVPLIQSYIKNGNKVILCVNEIQQFNVIKSALKDHKIDFEIVKDFVLPEKNVALSQKFIATGFELKEEKIVYISSKELFNSNNLNPSYLSRFKEGQMLKSYDELKKGDYVVHEQYGIGQFAEILTLEVDNIHRDYLKIIYRNNKILYVPLEQFKLVRKYSSKEGVVPKLSSLSNDEWSKRKKHIKDKINDLADKLLALYSYRKKEKGFAFSEENELSKEFEDAFPYQLTLDQAKAWEDIKADMEKDLIMDRLICGDVGFGKTELAFRAAFKAILDQKQVVMMCPTTLLAKQHFQVAINRFLTFPSIKIDLLTRQTSPKKINKIFEELANGKLNFVIGTHKLLNEKINYYDLGLLIIDEEQRFGVKQKEQLKSLKQNVDVLSLSATPIPRTLQMALISMRSISEINTPPINRIPIQTYVLPFNENVVEELISRELNRDGQVFYLFNNVETIYLKAYNISKLFPSIPVGVIHGQMASEKSEEIITDFYQGKIKILVCTTIIENGIDVANANLLIVENADHFGLAQLYQIRGRVGRGNKLAYCYLFYNPNKKMNEEAQKRLNAIQEFTSLGSGYKIAQRDLLIRGSGDILGKEQAGFIDSIGFDLYLKMLNETINEKETGLKTPEIKEKNLLLLDAYIPANFADYGDKIGIYQELESLKNNEDLQIFYKKIKDIYGTLPPSFSLLIQKKKLDILLSNKEFENIEDNVDYTDLTLSNIFSSLSGIGIKLFNELTPYTKDLKLSYVNHKIQIRIIKTSNWFDLLFSVASIVHEIFIEYSN